jgi:type I restriction enzyme R subunit
MKMNIVAASNEDTVVTEYTPEKRMATDYQTEAELENEFIKRLGGQGYDFFDATSEEVLTSNLRKQLELLNDYTFSDKEWQRLFTGYLAIKNESVLDKTRKVQVDFVYPLRCDNGQTKNIRIIDKTKIHNNRLQVMNQYEETGGNRKTRYDVTILVNGLPLLHIELKRRGVAIREAFNQIKRYDRDSFWAGRGLFEYIQIYVISNGTHTKYYSNTTRERHIKESSNVVASSKTKKTSNSFEFTNFWADASNKAVSDLVDFTKTFFAKHTILNILTRYCVFTTDKDLLVMRPYQIAATERILNRIECATTYKKMGTLDAGGYIWHTTGSGKTLTSFKTAQLATGMQDIEKVLFVVDRKDLDYQTMKEYDKFEKGAANSNTSTAVLQKQLENTNTKIIITTIQKLDIFIAKNKVHDIYKKHIVIIFDECHRSQFGDMHIAIKKAFKNYHIFGFTGTPIFAKNSLSGGNPAFKTTEQAFGEKLHTYTIVDAIKDANVLPFRIDYLSTVKAKDNIRDEKVNAINTKEAMMSPLRITENTRYILEHFDQKTYRNQNGSHYFHRVISNVKEMVASRFNLIAENKNAQRVNGFNSIFAVSSIQAAMLYYQEFIKQMKEMSKNLNIALIYSFSANEEDADEQFDNSKLDKTSRDFLDSAIKDYNKMFDVSYDTSSDKFQNYYKDVSMRVKNREIDLLIVVNMFLTGFDATTLNTLWVDKNLRHHGLIQAFSRTNRILNSVKTFGNIVCFRDLKQETDDAISLFGDKEAGGLVLIKTFNEYYNGFEEKGNVKNGYKDLIAELLSNFPLGIEIVGEQAQKDFINLFGAVLRMKNILVAFDEFKGTEILSERDFQDYQSQYLDLYQTFTKKGESEKADITADLVFEIELIKQIEVNIDYILMLVMKYHESNCTDKSILLAIDKAAGSSIELRSKRELIEGFIERVNTSKSINEDWRDYVRKQKERELGAIIEEERLKDVETQKFIDNTLRDGVLKTTGTDIDRILPPSSMFDGSRQNKKKVVVEKLLAFFDKFLGLI